MSKFFPSWQKAVGLVVISMLGVVAYTAANKFFGIERKLPSSMKRAA